MRQFLVCCLGMLVSLPALAVSAIPQPENIDQYRGWIENMKVAERGPFSRIRWFCNDGTTLPPRPYACKDHGGGRQHGEWSEQTLELRSQGFLIANVMASMDASTIVDDPDFHNIYAQLLIERFLVAADDGWIFRLAQFYRGALQAEGERAAARRLLIEMASRPYWIGPGFPALRAGVRTLPHGTDNASIQKVRQVSASLSDTDPGFKPLRAKIHGSPGAEDADAVREYAQALESDAARQPYLELADDIDGIYRAEPLGGELESMAERYTAAPWLQKLLRDHAASLRNDDSAANTFRVTAELMADLRRYLGRVNSHQVRLDLLDLSLRAEGEHFRAASELRPLLPGATRQQRVRYLKFAGLAAYGNGVINARLLDQMERTLDTMTGDSIPLDQYKANLSYLGRAPGWGTQTLRMFFFDGMTRLAMLEPLAMLFIQDQLRGSPLFLYARTLDTLSRDANQLAGVKHRLFDESIGVGFTALNPGLARGVLHANADPSDFANFRPDGIYMLPETVSDLPPVAGILTMGEGNPLSHVQLLARNLGIPNVTVDQFLIEKLTAYDGREVVMAVSHSGLVEIEPWSDRWKAVFEDAEAQGKVQIQPDLEKLDLSVNEMVQLDDLRAADSGRTVGPKAAKLGELRMRYPGHVSRGIAIPFGVFKREALDRPYPGGDGTVFEWMVRNYDALPALSPDDPELVKAAEPFRAELHEIISNTPLSDAFKADLQQSMDEAFGGQAPPGLFIRSDTNVEDLPGFTGAGLNLTLPNVVGFDNLLDGIKRVWASPFSARAFAWRQAHMNDPEHVYTSILLLESVGSDKSGVLVTENIDTGDHNQISVAVNEGLGGAVDGQAAESLRIPLDGSRVRVLATATAPLRRVPNPAGGLTILPSSGADTVLQPPEIDQLIDFSENLPANFPSIVDDNGNPAAADVEFGFLDGDLRLFQLRPFLDSDAAGGIQYLQQMEARLKQTGNVDVDLNGVPDQ